MPSDEQDAQEVPSGWDEVLLHAPAAHPDDDSGHLLSDLCCVESEDALILSGGGAATVPPASVDFALPDPHRGPVGRLAIHQGYLDKAQRLLQDLKARDDSATTNVAATVAYIKQILLDDSKFVAGNWHYYAELWGKHLRSIPRWPQRARVMEWIRQGYPIDWVDPESEAQREHPRFKAKRYEVKAMLEQVVPLEEVPSYMTGTRPRPVAFPNRRSAMQHEDFTDGAIRDLVESGMAVLHDPSLHDPVAVINPLAVVVQRTKKRLVVDLRYVNRFVRYEPVRYEQLTDVLSFVQRGWFAIVTDLKSGYHHLRLRR